MEKLIDKVVEFINKNNGNLIIGISGHGASGKTTFTKHLCNQLNFNNYNILNTDPYIISSQYRKFTKASYSYEGNHYDYKVTACMPVAHELNGLTRDIKCLKNGEDIFTIDTSWMPSHLLKGGRKVTFVEGMSVAFVDKKLFDLTIYIFTDGQTELKRRSHRDIKERGGNLQSLKSSHAQRRIQYELFMHPRSKNFDFVVDDSDNQFKLL
ncbi:uridine kinase [Salinicoccus roseus]|uniref:uridine kinase family protein n=1 Tax=Salinicoccus roseus TaxID=45670 RepID=UPI0035694578